MRIKNHFSKIAAVMFLFFIILTFQNCGLNRALRSTSLDGKSSILGGADAILSSPNAGRDLYAANCANCHGAVDSSAKKGKSAAEITSAITSVGLMNGLTILSSAQIASIADALKLTSSKVSNCQYSAESNSVNCAF